MKLLIAEDELALQQSIATYLERDANICETAVDFEEASYKISLYEYDVVVLDINLKNGSGLEILKLMKKNNNHAGGYYNFGK